MKIITLKLRHLPIPDAEQVQQFSHILVAPEHRQKTPSSQLNLHLPLKQQTIYYGIFNFRSHLQINLAAQLGLPTVTTIVSSQPTPKTLPRRAELTSHRARNSISSGEKPQLAVNEIMSIAFGSAEIYASVHRGEQNVFSPLAVHGGFSHSI